MSMSSASTLPVLLTGIKPTGIPHLGNYFGTIRPALAMAQDSRFAKAQFYYFIADYHSLIGIKDRQLLRDYVLEVACTWLACGLDPQQVVFFKQSDIPEILELSWILTCFTPKGDLNRAHAYKAVRQSNIDQGVSEQDLDQGVSAGLFMYPVLMAADILCFDTSLVPVGEDQRQHVEMCRAIVGRINETVKRSVLRAPQEVIQPNAKIIPGLDGRKMSKSYHNTINLFAPEKELQKLINRFKTDSSAPHEPKDPDQCILFYLYQLVAPEVAQQELRARYANGIGWGEVKKLLFEQLNPFLAPMREKYLELKAKPVLVEEILQAGGVRARAVAKEQLARVKQVLM